MKETIALVLGLLLAILLYLMNPIFGIAAWLSIAAGASLLLKLREEAKEQKSLNGRIEDLHILTTNPETGEEPHVARHKGNYIVSDYHKIHKTAQEWRDKLKASGNPLYIGVDDEGKKIADELRICVKPIIFRHGEHCNEYWHEYLNRAEEEISQDRKQKHGKYAQDAESFYNSIMYNFGDAHRRRKRS